MNRPQLVPGRIAVSLAGRDEGRKFVVIQELDDQLVLIADGSLRTMSRPKKKKRKHLRATASTMEMPEGRLPMDHEIRKVLCLDPEKEG